LRLSRTQKGLFYRLKGHKIGRELIFSKKIKKILKKTFFLSTFRPSASASLYGT
jgi:hypothetical protein